MGPTIKRIGIAHALSGCYRERTRTPGNFLNSTNVLGDRERVLPATAPNELFWDPRLATYESRPLHHLRKR
jgi:hypothetical protein